MYINVLQMYNFDKKLKKLFKKGVFPIVIKVTGI